MKEATAIIVLYYNKVRLTIQCIQSILAARYPPGQVFCFDNGSSPDVAAQVRQFFPTCNHLGIPNNLGFSGGFNRSLAHVFSSTFTSAMFCTNDTHIQSHTVETCAATAAQTRAGIVAPLITHLSNPDKIDAIGAWFDKETGLLHHYQEQNLPILLAPDKDYIPGTALWITKAAFTTLGGTDESFHMYWEDVDLCFRAHQHHIPLARAYEAHIAHGGGQTCRKKPLYTTFYFQRNRIRFCQRYLEGENKIKVLEIIQQELLQSSILWQQNNDQRRLNYFHQLMQELTPSPYASNT